MYKPTDFIPTSLEINSWDDLKPYFQKLDKLPLESIEDLERLILNSSEVLSVYYEQNARAYIEMTCHTEDKALVERHEIFATKISPEVQLFDQKIKDKIAKHKLFKELPTQRYAELQKGVLKELELFRKENVDLGAQLAKLSSNYGQLAGSLMAEIDGETLTLPQAAVKLESQDREERKKAWLAISGARKGKRAEHNEIYDQMLNLRHQMALNAGFKNFRDFKHEDLHRFDFTVDDVLKFHDSIEKFVMPLQKKVTERKIKKLGLEAGDFRPWDSNGKPADERQLKPFNGSDELLEKSIQIFDKIKPEFGNNLRKMRDADLFDLESRKGKAPGGYNYGLEVTGMPFIFMNAAGTHSDVVTLMHEGGHAMHTFLTNNESLIEYRHTSSEMAETASMAMELISSSHWNLFYPDAADLKEARIDHLERIIGVFGWVAIVDGFQHWVYTNPTHTHEERDAAFNNLMTRFGTGLVNWEGHEDFLRMMWQKQLHIFEVPFYYIEYAIAQLGALQVYRNYKKDPVAAIDDYIRGLSMGGTKSVSQVWDAMNIKFDFSADTVEDLMQFVGAEYDLMTS